MSAILEERENLPRDGDLTFSRCLGVGNLTPASMKMSNSPGSAASIFFIFLFGLSHSSVLEGKSAGCA